jgi:outer membrane protein W
MNTPSHHKQAIQLVVALLVVTLLALPILALPLVAQAQNPYEAHYTGAFPAPETGTSTILEGPINGKEPELPTEETKRWRLRLDFSWVNSSGSTVSTKSDFGLDSGFGGGLRAEYLFTERLGVELGVLGTGSIDMASELTAGRFANEFSLGGYSAVSAGLNVHLTPNDPIDLYIGPQLALFNYSSIDSRAGSGFVGGSLSVDDDIGIGAMLGLDIPFGDSSWIFHSSLRYFDTDINDSGGGSGFDRQYDPTIFSLGVGLQF